MILFDDAGPVAVDPHCGDARAIAKSEVRRAKPFLVGTNSLHLPDGLLRSCGLSHLATPFPTPPTFSGADDGSDR